MARTTTSKVSYPIPSAGPNQEPLFKMPAAAAKKLIGRTCSYIGWESEAGEPGAVIVDADCFVAIVRNQAGRREAVDWGNCWVRPAELLQQERTALVREARSKARAQGVGAKAGASSKGSGKP